MAPDAETVLIALPAWRPFAAWIAAGAVLHLIWEIAQLPLYTIWLEPDKAYVAFAVAHCTAGDILIAASTYVAAAVVLRDARWLVGKPWRGALIAIPLGFMYTAWSEWSNVYSVGAWAYRPAMPLAFGIGLAPLAQWIAVPAAAIVMIRRWWDRAIEPRRVS